MSKKVDVIDVKVAVKKGELKAFVHDGFILLEDTISGEQVRLAGGIVPCKECKHYVWNSFGDGCWVCIKHARYGFRPSDFCAYGERKDNG